MGIGRRQLLLDLATIATTLALLSGIVVAASGEGAPTEHNPQGCPSGHDYVGSATKPLEVGYTTDVWHLPRFERAVAPYHVSMFGAFMNWGSAPHPDRADREGPWKWLAEARQLRVAPMFTWEPWPGAGVWDAHHTEAASWSAAAIANGSRDRYIRMWARAIKRYGRPVYVRLAHEMNGSWYPWSASPTAYVQMWRHVVDLFRQVGATNARFVWSVYLPTWQTTTFWCTQLMRYWPGSRYVDDVGATVINFGADKAHELTMPLVEGQLQILRAFGKPIDIAEFNAAWGVRVQYFTQMARYLRHATWIHSLVISEAPSETPDIAGRAGELNWNLLRDKPTLAIVRSIMRERGD